MSDKNTKNESDTDWDLLESMSDDEIDSSDIPELGDSFFERAQIRMPKTKQHISLRLDPEVVLWFKKEGRGYQTRMNAVLKAYVEAQATTAQGE